MKIEFDHEKGQCGGGAEKGRIWKSGNSIRFEGVAKTPNPCYRLSLSHSKSKNQIVLRVRKQSSPGICVQCIATIRFHGKISSINMREVKGKEIILKIGEKKVCQTSL